MMGAIDDISRGHRKSQIVVSSRDTFRYPRWPNAFAVRLVPFSDEQLRLFVDTWFTSQPSARKALGEWFGDNEKMRATAKTPLIAALLCSLYDAGAEMPSTESELYSARFELLLGKWEKAKRVVPLGRTRRKLYYHFLMSFAMSLQYNGKRSGTHEAARMCAARVCAGDRELMPDSLIEDCVRRGVIEREKNGGLSFGHLTYQEFLSAEWLCENNPARFIYSRLLTPWWEKTLEYYAVKKLDITPLVNVGLKYRGESRSLDRISRLAELAPLTSNETLRSFMRLSRSEEIQLFPWARPPDLGFGDV